MTIGLIAVNIAVFIWQLTFPTNRSSSPQLERLGVNERDQNSIAFGAIPYRITHPGKDCFIGEKPSSPSFGPSGPSVASGTSDVFCRGTPASRRADANGPTATVAEAPWFVTLFSSMFMHGGFLHIGFNMLFLWVFGNNVEDSMGRGRFLLFYLLAGLVAVYSQAALDLNGTTPTIGASGAIAGVLGAYALLFPRARVLTLIFIIFFVTLIEIPALIMLGIWFVLQFLPAVGQVATPAVGSGGGVAYFAHVGGFIFGLALAKLFVAGRRRAAPVNPAT